MDIKNTQTEQKRVELIAMGVEEFPEGWENTILSDCAVFLKKQKHSEKSMLLEMALRGYWFKGTEQLSKQLESVIEKIEKSRSELKEWAGFKNRLRRVLEKAKQNFDKLLKLPRIRKALVDLLNGMEKLDLLTAEVALLKILGN